MGVHAWAADLAKTLFAQNGRAVTLRKDTAESSGDPWSPAVTESSVRVTAMVTNTGLSGSQTRNLVDGVTVLSGDIVAFVAARDIPAVPEPLDRIVDGATVYTIHAVNSLQPGSDVVFYQLVLRK